MSSILKRPVSPGPSPSNSDSNSNPSGDRTAKRVKLEENLQDSEELYDPDLDDGLARVGQVSASTELGSNLKEAKADAEAEAENGVQQELLALLKRPTGLDKLIALASLPHPLPAFEPVCPLTTTTACPESSTTCPYPHYEPIIRPWTEPRLGQCSYLNMCYGDPLFHSNPSLINSGGQGPGPGSSGAGGKQCRYQHYRLVPPPSLVADHKHEEDRSRRREKEREKRVPRISKALRRKLLGPRLFSTMTANPVLGAAHDDQDGMKDGFQLGQSKGVCEESQWLNMDVRQLDEKVLDPPWDIHMNLPYLLLTDDDLRRLPIPSLQPTWGLLALWVTGRAMELARELFALWGYRRVDEVVWVKTGQLGGLVRTGRTGHWLNHTCEHLLLAVKLPPVSEFPDRNAPIPWGDPALAHLRRGIDGDVVVSEVRETSRKPDEVYGLLERMVPSGRKLEIFGRTHNTRPKWLTIGNQRKQTRGILTAVPVTAAEENALTCLQLVIAKWLTPNSSERWKKPRSC
ncbi:hypothetical protein FFLO_03021 [Filobasidium floriforme]|uniref:mRNA m(6)A methyltransferase n=1 Tax=Filobasidium floriforme TaxID=5210 RepID=A0A8K0NTK0_9TREE|nr:hypothetical protein FFLO_03021 [Filobasidium floriforme]